MYSQTQNQVFFQRPVNLKKIEFRSIEKGLEKNSEVIQPQNQPSDKKLKYLLIKTNCDHFQKNDLSDNQADNSQEERQRKFNRLRKQPPTFFEKIPRMPISMSNSTRITKEIQIRILAKSKKAVKEHQVDSFVKTTNAQDNAVREMLDTYKSEFSFKSAMDAKKKRQLDDLKEKYLKTFFIKNSVSKPMQFQHMTPMHRIFAEPSDFNKVLLTKSSDMSSGIQRNFTLQAGSIVEPQTAQFKSPDYCSFLKALIEKKKQYSSFYMTQS